MGNCTGKQTEKKSDNVAPEAPCSKGPMYEMQNLNTNKFTESSNNDQIEDKRHSAVKTGKAIYNQEIKIRDTSAKKSPERKSVHDDDKKSGESPESHSQDSYDDKDVWDRNIQIDVSHSPSEPISNQNVGEHDNYEGIYTFDGCIKHVDATLCEVNKNDSGKDTTGRQSPSKPISNLQGGTLDNQAGRQSPSKPISNLQEGTMDNQADLQPPENPDSDTVVNKHERTKAGDSTTFVMTKDMAETVDQRLRNHTGLRIVLIGKTGSGKSCTGNTILGRDAFMSSDSANSVTSECRSEKSKINGRIVTVVDTPGIFDTRHTEKEMQTEIARCIGMVMPGPHAIILVVPFGRFTEETQESFDYFCKHFGEDMFKYLIILFTKSEDLKHKKQTLDNYVHTSTRLMGFAKRCGNRYVGFSNTASEKNKGKQVLNLLTKIDSMIHENGGTWYTDDMFKRVENSIFKEIHEEEKLKEKEHERQVKLIEGNFSEKYQMVIKQHEKRIAQLESEDLTTSHDIENMKKESEVCAKREVNKLKLKKEKEIQELETQKFKESEKRMQPGNIRKRIMKNLHFVINFLAERVPVVPEPFNIILEHTRNIAGP